MGNQNALRPSSQTTAVLDSPLLFFFHKKTYPIVQEYDVKWNHTLGTGVNGDVVYVTLVVLLYRSCATLFVWCVFETQLKSDPHTRVLIYQNGITAACVSAKKRWHDMP